MKKPVCDIKRGDVFMDGSIPIWTAMTNARYKRIDPQDSLSDVVIIDIKFHRDGGICSRTWDDTTHVLNIRDRHD